MLKYETFGVLWLLLFNFASSRLQRQEVSILPISGTATAVSNESFTVLVQLANNSSFVSCKFRKQNALLEVKPGSLSPSHDGLKYWEDERKTQCQLTIKPMLEERSGYWTIDIVDENYDLSSFSYQINMEQRYPTFSTNITAQLGSQLRQSCEMARRSGEDYVQIFNPSGKMFAEGPKAIIDIPQVRFEDQGAWKCLDSSRQNIYALEETVNLEVIPRDHIEANVTESETEVTLSCRSYSKLSRNGGYGSQPRCTFKSPTGKLITPYHGVYTNKYSFFGKASNCGLSIKKPLDEEDKGAWKCFALSPKHASILHVSGPRNASSGSTRSKSVAAVVGNPAFPLIIQCSVPEAIKYCYVRSPLGRIFSSRSTVPGIKGLVQYTGLGLGIGDCELTIHVNSLWANETGKWLCGMGVTGQVSDVQVEIDVEIGESPFVADSMLVKGWQSSSVTLRCHSVMGHMLEYCQFMDPVGKSFSLAKDSKAGKYSYEGRGLEYGDCALQISEVEYEDFGTWTCSAAILGSDFEYSNSIHTNQNY